MPRNKVNGMIFRWGRIPGWAVSRVSGWFSGGLYDPFSNLSIGITETTRGDVYARWVRIIQTNVRLLLSALSECVTLVIRALMAIRVEVNLVVLNRYVFRTRGYVFYARPFYVQLSFF